MKANQIFSLANTFALVAWLILIVFPRARWSARLVTGVIVPLLFASLYASLLALHWGKTTGGFRSLGGVASLFANPWILLAGWVHYLAFDLFIGSWEIRDATRLQISYWLVRPCLILTFLFGPVGLFLYFVVRFVRARSLLLAA